MSFRLPCHLLLSLALVAPTLLAEGGRSDAANRTPLPSKPAAAAPADPPKAGSLPMFLAAVNRQAMIAAGPRTVRLAVIPIKGTESARYADKGFGAFLTEKISSSMVSAGSPIRLFERTRLDAVLKEQALSASGMFDESEARKIGELAPIDLILTGTFTRLDQSIAVNLRFIDVVSGEVRGNVAENLDLTPDLAALFEEVQTKPMAAALTGAKPAGPDCEPRWAPVKALMEDIGTPAKQEKLVEAAMAIPFEGPCGDIHYRVIDLLRHHKRYSDRYAAFLLKTLQGIEAPDADDRDGAILEYLLAPGQLDEAAWTAGLRVASMSKRFYAYQELLLTDKLGTPASRKRLQERLGVILAQVEQRKIGRPVPVETGRTFIELLGTLRSLYLSAYNPTKDIRPLMDAYQTYAGKYAKAPDKRLLELLSSLYTSAGPGKDREKVLGWWCERVNRFPPSRELEDPLVSFMRKLFEARKPGPRHDPGAQADLKRIATVSGPRVAETIPFIIGRDYRLDITGFCLEHGIRAPGIVPDLAALTEDLSSEETAVRQEAIRLMRHLGPRALPAEPAVLKQLRRTENKSSWDGQNKYVQHDLIGLLGSMETRNPDAHAMLIKHLKSIESYVADEAVLALSHIGEPAAPALKAEFPKIEEAYKQMRVLKVFHLRGKAAAAHLPWLTTIFQTSPSPHVRDAAEDAIEAIRKS